MKLSAVIFPDTVLSEQVCIPLLPVFKSIVYLQPLENDPAAALGHDNFSEVMQNRSRCRVHVPAPLGKDRERFCRLVDDLRTRRDDYAQQLGHQTLAGLSSASGRRAETKSSIVGSLLAGHGIHNDGDDRRKMVLWQARLLLKLAEMHAEEQEELRQQIREIRDKELNLLNGLRDEKALPFALSGILADDRENASARRQQRKSWSRLLALGDVPLVGDRVFLTRDRDGFDILVETYEKQTKRAPVTLGHLSLPAISQDSENFILRADRFEGEAAELLSRLEQRLAAGGETDALFVGSDQYAWEMHLERLFPAAEWGRARLSLIACPDRSAEQLFIETFAPEEKEFLRLEKPQGVLLGVVEAA